MTLKNVLEENCNFAFEPTKGLESRDESDDRRRKYEKVTVTRRTYLFCLDARAKCRRACSRGRWTSESASRAETSTVSLLSPYRHADDA